MTLADVPLPSGLRLIVDGLIEAVRRGVRGFARGGVHFNAPPGLSLALLNRLARILRFAFLIVATQVELTPARLRRRGQHGVRKPTASRGFSVFPPRRRLLRPAEPGPAPAHLARAVRDHILMLRRKHDALLAALAAPLPVIRRTARRLATQLSVFGWFPPKRPPRRRAYEEEEREGFAEAWHQVRTFRRRSIDNALASATAS